ncbi:ABC transporter permease [Boudabousia liubingyangii]|uniref:ABC transporter permease n=1 Tax=Boudabousia liubingyangii TaxID=1921764 RepID=A0A1Q5PLL1_9ACTO|nr:sugar ABC transporter permease [Boudabousia liubingyangii]OKL47933.1 ABC transporter permease [Boudabousia liubingyangii]
MATTPVPIAADELIGDEENLKSIKARQRRNAAYGWAFLAPFILFFVVSFLIPIIVSVISAFYKETASGGGLYGGGEKTLTFVWFDNFITVIKDTDFWVGMGRVLLFGVIQIPVMIGGALALALLLDSLFVKRVTFFRLSYFLPYAVPGIIAAMMWIFMYNPNFGPVGKIMPFSMFDRHVMLFSMANMTTWTFTGYNMLIFLAALQAIPTDLYEAARLDGASEFKIVTKIKIPMLKGAALLAILLSIIGTVQLFNEPAALSVTNPDMGGKYTPMMMAYNAMMGNISPSGAGPANAVSLLMAVFAAALAFLYTYVQKKVD